MLKTWESKECDDFLKTRKVWNAILIGILQCRNDEFRIQFGIETALLQRNDNNLFTFTNNHDFCEC